MVTDASGLDYIPSAGLRIVVKLLRRLESLVHGDFHTGNMMVQGGEIVLIDMAGMALTFEYITTDDRAMHTLRMTVDEMHRYYDALLKEYYGTDDEALLQKYAYQRKLHSLVKLLYGMVKTDAVPEPMKTQVLS